ncbi:hypothetical protein XELAEV_18008030mg [Xenopus laevis]|uniref:Uncharacterized protein n=1 Tax=Xenopus laevis TaxID=8355 RepID=A0A974E2A8_XENLA|nr:hypothetical protein XELAEV_18008030mg [Xenopus laevis]
MLCTEPLYILGHILEISPFFFSALSFSFQIVNEQISPSFGITEFFPGIHPKVFFRSETNLRTIRLLPLSVQFNRCWHVEGYP